MGFKVTTKTTLHRPHLHDSCTLHTFLLYVISHCVLIPLPSPQVFSLLMQTHNHHTIIDFQYVPASSVFIISKTCIASSNWLPFLGSVTFSSCFASHFLLLLSSFLGSLSPGFLCHSSTMYATIIHYPLNNTSTAYIHRLYYYIQHTITWTSLWRSPRWLWLHLSYQLSTTLDRHTHFHSLPPCNSMSPPFKPPHPCSHKYHTYLTLQSPNAP